MSSKGAPGAVDPATAKFNPLNFTITEYFSAASLRGRLFVRPFRLRGKGCFAMSFLVPALRGVSPRAPRHAFSPIPQKGRETMPCRADPMRASFPGFSEGGNRGLKFPTAMSAL